MKRARVPLITCSQKYTLCPGTLKLMLHSCVDRRGKCHPTTPTVASHSCGFPCTNSCKHSRSMQHVRLPEFHLLTFCGTTFTKAIKDSSDLQALQVLHQVGSSAKLDTPKYEVLEEIDRSSAGQLLTDWLDRELCGGSAKQEFANLTSSLADHILNTELDPTFLTHERAEGEPVHQVTNMTHRRTDIQETHGGSTIVFCSAQN